MRKLLLILLVFPNAFYKIVAQSEPKLACPAVSAVVPSGVTNPGDLIEFSASVIPEAPANIEYFWSVDRGHIVRGQGTKTIGVDWPGRGEVRVAASVTVKGLALGCPNTASDDYSMILDAGPEKMVEISGGWEKLDRSDLSKIKKKLLNDPNAQLYIFLYFERNTSQSSIRHTKRALSAYLTKRRIGAERIVLETYLEGHKGAAIWFVPPGSFRPTP